MKLAEQPVQAGDLSLAFVHQHQVLHRCRFV